MDTSTTQGTGGVPNQATADNTSMTTEPGAQSAESSGENEPDGSQHATSRSNKSYQQQNQEDDNCFPKKALHYKEGNKEEYATDDDMPGHSESPDDFDTGEDTAPLQESSLPETSATGSVSKSGHGRRQRNSLALRKNSPIHFSEGWALSSLPNNSSFLEVVKEPGAQLDGSVRSNRSVSSRRTKGGSKIISLPKLSRWNLLRSTCLNPRLSLRTQLFLSFGFVSITMISFVMVVCIAVTINSGQNVNKSTLKTYDDLAEKIEGRTVRYTAEFLTHRLIPSDLVGIISEATRDRIAGYPDAPGFAEDAHVPFFDIESNSNRYPIVAPPLPLDWQIEYLADINETNYREHVDDRWRWYNSRRGDGGLSTQNAGYHMQGVCDPEATDISDPPSLHRFYPDCTDANNDLRTGGAVAPTETNELLHRKSSELTPLLKALYEYHQDLKSVGVAFANGGAGSTVRFPHYQCFTNETYISQGCDWMRNVNPYAPGQNLGSEDEIARCHAAGTEVPYREYNPLEHNWCQAQALQPQKIHIDGPYSDPTWDDTLEQNLWSLTVGQALFDRVTNKFIGCVQIVIVLEFLEKALLESRVTKSSHVTVARWDEFGTVIASSARNMTLESRTISVDQLEVGVTRETYVKLKNLVDYDAPWNSSDLRKTYESFMIKKDGFLVGAYPMPPPPASYDPTYRPEFFAIKSIFEEDVFGQLYSSQESVDDKVEELVRLSLFIGIIGIVSVLIITALVSNRLTSPLRFMNDVATEIVNNYVNSSEDGIEISQPAKYASCCTPKTEVSEVVAEFQNMVSRFSGTTSAKSMKRHYTEVKNRFDMFNEFADIYQSRVKDGFRYAIKVGEAQQSVGGVDSGAQNTVLNRRHQGTLLCQEGSLSSTPELRLVRQDSNSSLTYFFAKKRRKIRSPLFYWIVFLIATPLLITTITLSTIVMYRISTDFPHLVEDAKADFVSLDIFALRVYVKLRANFVSEVTSRSTRDLHLANRYLSWALFGGIKRSDSFTELTTGAEACKFHANLSECPFVKDFHCDCSWKKVDRPDRCHQHTNDSRYLQKAFYTCEALDTMKDGDRNSTSFPELSFSPNTTSWWHDVNSVPGSEKGNNATGYDTTYDRIRALSAFPLYQSLLNYDSEKNHVEGVYAAMEDDGLVVGYSGCEPPAGASQWQATEENGAPELRPELCPDGKFGYDPRCREWYNTARKRYLGNATSFYLTSPYMYSTGVHAQSATATFIDPKTKKYVGQVLVDFRSTEIFEALSAENTPIDEGGFPVMITPGEDNFGGDTVIAQGYDSTMGSISVLDVVMGDCMDPESDCEGVDEVVDAVSKMKRGEEGLFRIPLKFSDNSTALQFAAYAPVKVKVLSPVDSSDFARGVESTDQMIYSLTLVESEASILAPFKAIEDDVTHERNVALIILCTAIVLSTLLVVYLSSKVAVSIANPMLYLLDLIRHINRLSADDVTASSPEVNRNFGCLEVRNVSDTMEVLYKVVRDANVAFFSGDIETAYAVLIDTSRLFERLGNKKAIGVSNNNLGNMMLTMYRTMVATEEEYVCGFTREEIVKKGVSYFHKAIKLGEASYDRFYEEEGWSPNCLEFMQHLSNRYFNRAMFVLTAKNSHTNPLELEELGFRDLRIVRDMDVEIVDEGTQAGWNVRTAEQLFDVKLGRIKGHLQLLEMGYRDNWEVNELLEDAFQIVKDEVKKDYSMLFEELSSAGRMQQVECEMLKYMVLTNDLKTGAKIAIRMLLEDEFTLPEAQTKAVEVLLAFVKSKDVDNSFEASVEKELSNYQDWLSAIEEEHDLRQSTSVRPDKDDMSEVFQMSTARFSTISRNDRESIRSSIRESTRGDFTMEVF